MTMGKYMHECEWLKAQKISISMDLVHAAKQLIQFLRAVDNFGNLYDGPVLDHAIYRYKNCWLPLLAKHSEFTDMTEPLVVPLDCEWIWHCHRLNPVQYKKDCEEVYGWILGNLNISSSIERTSTKESERVWNLMFPHEPYNFEKVSRFSLRTNMAKEEFGKDFPYDLVAAVKRQSASFKKVSKLSMTIDHSLNDALKRYKAFLYLIGKSEERSMGNSVVPAFDIDIIWHAHQLNPVSYSNDLAAIFGKIMGHNDDTLHKNLKPGLDRTSKLWKETYGRDYLMTSSILKGDDKEPDPDCSGCDTYWRNDKEPDPDCSGCDTYWGR